VSVGIDIPSNISPISHISLLLCFTYTERNYCALNVMLDEAVANLTCSLNNYGYNDNTYLIIASDNGGRFPLSYYTFLYITHSVPFILSLHSHLHSLSLIFVFFLLSFVVSFFVLILGDPTTGVGSSHPFKGYKNLAWNGGVAATAIIHRYADLCHY